MKYLLTTKSSDYYSALCFLSTQHFTRTLFTNLEARMQTLFSYMICYCGACILYTMNHKKRDKLFSTTGWC